MKATNLLLSEFVLIRSSWFASYDENTNSPEVQRRKLQESYVSSVVEVFMFLPYLWRNDSPGIIRNSSWSMGLDIIASLRCRGAAHLLFAPLKATVLAFAFLLSSGEAK